MTQNSNKTQVIMLVDAWFPSSNDGPGEVSGIQIHVQKLRESLEKFSSCQVELFFPANPNSLIRWSWSLLVIGQVLKYAKNNHIDIIHSHGNLSALPAKILSFLLKKPVVNTIHRADHISLHHKTPTAFLQWLSITQIKYSAEITISSSIAKIKNRNQNIHVIPNGIDLMLFNQVRVQKNPDPTIIWVGRDDPTKGLEYLRKAVTKIRKTIPNLQTNFVTGGRLVGTELIKAYKQAYVFVLPSLSETQPMTLLEAWAAKLPVVVTSVGDNQHMVKDGVNGLLVEPANVKQLTHAIIKVLKAKVAHKRLGAAGYEYVKQHYSWRQVAIRTNKIYQEVIDS